MNTALVIEDVRLTPILVSDPPLLNTQGVHQPYTPRLIVEVVTRGGTDRCGRRTATPPTWSSARSSPRRSRAGRSPI